MQHLHLRLKNLKQVIMTSRFKIQIKTNGGEARWADAGKVFAHLLDEHNKKEDKFKELFKNREEKFIKQVNDYSGEYDDDILEDFIGYWTEPNRSNTKMKFELEKTWSISRRLSKWKKNSFGKNKKSTANYKLDTTGNAYNAWCSKCGKHDFYPTYGNPSTYDSNCCGAEILPGKKE